MKVIYRKEVFKITRTLLILQIHLKKNYLMTIYVKITLGYDKLHHSILNHRHPCVMNCRNIFQTLKVNMN